MNTAQIAELHDLEDAAIRLLFAARDVTRSIHPSEEQRQLFDNAIYEFRVKLDHPVNETIKPLGTGWERLALSHYSRDERVPWPLMNDAWVRFYSAIGAELRSRY